MLKPSRVWFLGMGLPLPPLAPCVYHRIHTHSFLSCMTSCPYVHTRRGSRLCLFQGAPRFALSGVFAARARGSFSRVECDVCHGMCLMCC